MKESKVHNGFITIHRKLFDSYLSTSAYRLALWVHLIAMANHRDNEFLFNGEKVTVKRGQFITGRKVLSGKTGISERYVEELLKEFEKYNMIQQQKTNRNRLITIVKYHEYQSTDSGVHNRATTGCTTERHKQQCNNDNNVTIGGKTPRFIPPLLTAVESYCLERRNGVNPEKFVNFYQSKDWMIGKNKMKDWKAAIRTWEKSTEPTQNKTGFHAKELK
jgi:hypothetical protein